MSVTSSLLKAPIQQIPHKASFGSDVEVTERVALRALDKDKDEKSQPTTFLAMSEPKKEDSQSIVPYAIGGALFLTLLNKAFKQPRILILEKDLFQSPWVKKAALGFLGLASGTALLGDTILGNISKFRGMGINLFGRFNGGNQGMANFYATHKQKWNFWTDTAKWVPRKSAERDLMGRLLRQWNSSW